MTDIPQSLLEALDSSASVFRAKKAVEEWFAAHDMVEVVRCKDCAFYAQAELLCFVWERCMDPYDYCAYGKPRDSVNAMQTSAPTTVDTCPHCSDGPQSVEDAIAMSDEECLL